METINETSNFIYAYSTKVFDNGSWFDEIFVTNDEPNFFQDKLDSHNAGWKGGHKSPNVDVIYRAVGTCTLFAPVLVLLRLRATGSVLVTDRRCRLCLVFLLFVVIRWGNPAARA